MGYIVRTEDSLFMNVCASQVMKNTIFFLFLYRKKPAPTIPVDICDGATCFNMFSGASQFNQDISHWDTSSVSSINGMFWAATSFNQSISNWDTSIVSEMAYMFNGATSFSQNLSHWRVPKIPSLPSYFALNSPLARNTGLHPQWNESTNR